MSFLLLDTHLLVWAAGDDPRLPAPARELIGESDREIAFSVVSIWEIAIKAALGRRGFEVEPAELREGLLASGYREVTVAAVHAIAVGRLPLLHRDPFDRMLVAQAIVEGAQLLTVDRILARYGNAVRLLG